MLVLICYGAPCQVLQAPANVQSRSEVQKHKLDKTSLFCVAPGVMVLQSFVLLP